MDIEAANALRAEYRTATPDRAEEIRVELAQSGEVVFPPGTPEYEDFRAKLRVALADEAQLAQVLFPNSH